MLHAPETPSFHVFIYLNSLVKALLFKEFNGDSENKYFTYWKICFNRCTRVKTRFK